MERKYCKTSVADELLDEFLTNDDLKSLAAGTGTMLGCPLLVLDDAFRVSAHYRPLGFSDPVFQNAVRKGEITYEAGAVISRHESLSAGRADYVKLEDSAYIRRFAPLISAGVRLGYLICVDTDGHLKNISEETWNLVDKIMAKQMFIEASRHDKPFGTTEDILMHLLEGGFSSEAYFSLQIAGTYLEDFHPSGFALIDLKAYHSMYLGKRHLKDELDTRFPHSHSFLYKGDIFMFLHGKWNFSGFTSLAEEFRLKIIMSELSEELFDLPGVYRTAHEALELMLDDRFHSGSVATVTQLRTPLLLKNLEGRRDLIPREIRDLCAHDREKNTQYCETLYYYLTYSRSLKKTCDALFTHRNTVLYRIHKMQDDFGVPLDDPTVYTDLLLGVSMVMFEIWGPDFFITAKECVDAVE